MTIDDIDPCHILKEPPELTPRVAAGRLKEINLMLHSLALIGDELDGARGLMPVLRASATLVGADRALMYQWDEGTGSLRLTTSLGFKGPLPKTATEGTMQVRGCLVHRKPVLVSAPRQESLKRELAQLHAAASLSVPMTHQGLPWGAVQLLRDRPFLAEDAILLWLYTLVLEGVLPAAMGLKRHREIAAPVDSVTGLLAPDHYRRRLAWEMRRSSWLDRPLTVACIEVTEMLHGRPRGSFISFSTRAASQVIQKALRQSDTITCMGGHHFVMTMPETTKPAARRVMDLIRETLLDLSAGTLPVFDIASGFATFPADGATESEMIRAACADGRKTTGRISRNPRVN